MHQPDQTEQIEVTARTPGRRALGAMAIAARRASSQAEGATRPQPDLEGLLRSVPSESVREPDPSFIWQEARPVERPEAQRQPEPPGPREPERERRLLVTVAVVTVVVVLAAVSLAILEAIGHQPLAVAPVSPAPSVTPHHSASAARSGAAHHKASRTSSSTTVPALTPGAAPAIGSLTPKSGAAGQTITIAGSNFMSPSGHISAAFDGQTASIVCPQPSTCTVTVPTLAAPPGPVKVTVTTDSGVSNSANFTYS